MSLTTHSRIYFDYEVDATKDKIAFKEGAGAELTATLDVGSYTMTEYAAEVERALNDTDGIALVYTVTVDRTTRKITIAATGTISLLVASGSTLGTTAYTTMGFTGADRTAAASYEGNLAAGKEYTTQFILQSHVGADSLKGAVEGVVNKSASGNKIEVVSFGEESFIKGNFKYVTNLNLGNGHIRYNSEGYADLVELMEFFITKAPFEFMADEDTVATFDKLILESTAQDKNGLKYELKELYDKGLPGFYETGTLTFRKVS